MLAFADRFETHDSYLAWLDTRPDEEHYEVVDGVPVMSPGPIFVHQRCVVRLVSLLVPACPARYEVLASPFDWVLWEQPLLNVRQPDLLIMKQPDDLHSRGVFEPPLLAVEVLSDSSIERDLVAKRRDYGRAGLDHYWVVDPVAPSITVYRRRAGELDLVGTTSGQEELSVTEPLTTRFRPADLIS